MPRNGRNTNCSAKQPTNDNGLHMIENELADAHIVKQDGILGAAASGTSLQSQQIAASNL